GAAGSRFAGDRFLSRGSLLVGQLPVRLLPFCTSPVLLSVLLSVRLPVRLLCRLPEVGRPVAVVTPEVAGQRTVERRLVLRAQSLTGDSLVFGPRLGHCFGHCFGH